MSDIVNELRDRSYATKAQDPLCERAADEIEGLRKLAARRLSGGRVPLGLGAALLECFTAKEQKALMLFDEEYRLLHGPAPDSLWPTLLAMLKELR